MTPREDLPPIEFQLPRVKIDRRCNSFSHWGVTFIGLPVFLRGLLTLPIKHSLTLAFWFFQTLDAAVQSHLRWQGQHLLL